MQKKIAAMVATIATVLVVSLSGESTPRVSAQEPKVINITAKRFAFEPSSVTLKKGETVTLRVRSEDVTHGLFSRQLKIDATIEPGKTEEITVTPQTAGKFTSICDHFCGSGHGNMAMTFVVE